ncbi:MAG: hypothetical protein U0930_03685 [Pirellulales bacterium]
MNENELRLRIGFGSLIAIAFIAVLHALTVSVTFQNPKMRDFEIVDLPPLLNPTSTASEPTFYSASQAQDLPAVNLQAQSELKKAEQKKEMAPYQPPNKSSKQQIGQIGPMQDCPNCPQPYNPAPYNPTPAPYYPAPRPPNNPAPGPNSGKPAKEYQLLLFVNTDAQSRQVLNWANNHPKFRFLRSTDSKVAVQVYSPGDQMYKLRYASVVPVSEFPAIVLADREGAHIHAASKQFIPNDPDKLYEDLKLGTQLYLQAKQQRPAQAVTSGAMTAARQYNWDDRISPDMRLQAESPPVEEGWRPLDNLRPGGGGGGLFDQCGPDGCKPKSALVWTNAEEMMIAGLVLIGVIAAIKLIGNMRK